MVIVDLDPEQASTTDWSERRRSLNGVDSPITVTASIDEIEAIVRTCEEQRVDLLVLDTKANVEVPVKAAAAIADPAVIPCGASLNEAKGIRPTVAIVKELGVASGIVVNKGRTGARKPLLVAEALANYGLPVCPTIVFQRAAVEDGFDVGQTAREFASRDKAPNEIKDTWTWIHKNINRVK